MAVLERKIIHDSFSSFSHISYSQFVLPRHRHPEFEIMIFTKGTGKQFVGDSIASYQPGDLALIGSNIPHLHLCDSVLNGGVATSSGEALQFPISIFPSEMESIPDYTEINDLLMRSQHGIRFYNALLWNEIYAMVMDVDKLAGIDRIILLYQILDKLSKTPDFKLLSESPYKSIDYKFSSQEPVDRVYSYLFSHFRENITLQQVASFVNLNPAALCRYFKRSTDKSIFRCLAEVRVGHACKLLAYSSLPVSQIAYESGYNNLSHFNRQFKEITKLAPDEYRKQVNRLSLD